VNIISLQHRITVAVQLQRQSSVPAIRRCFILGAPPIIADMQDNEKDENLRSETVRTIKSEVQRELAALKTERDSLYDRLLRKQAELQNYKKSVDREKAELAQIVPPDLMHELLLVLDSFELALRNAASEDEGDENMLNGFELIYKQFQDNLGRFGLKVIDAMGQKFDPSFHQAIATLATADLEENTVVEEMRKGYLLRGQLLRPALVAVSIKRTVTG
jgi:molecular chaperone GrpE